MTPAAALLLACRAAGVALAVQPSGRFLLKPAHAVTADLCERLSAHRSDVLAWLRAEAAPPEAVARRVDVFRAQLAGWRGAYLPLLVLPDTPPARRGMVRVVPSSLPRLALPRVSTRRVSGPRPHAS